MSSLDDLEYVTLDVFTNTRFRGNQLAVVHVPAARPLSQETKQAIAREFNYSETVFLHQASDDSNERQLDIFTVTQELPFAGHPVIGTIGYLCQATEPPLAQVALNIKAGKLLGTYDPLERRAKVAIPHNVHLHDTKVLRQHFLDCQTALKFGSDNPSAFPVLSIVKGMTFILAELPDLGMLAALQAPLQRISREDIKLDQAWIPTFMSPYYYVIIEKTQNFTKIRSRMLEPSVGEDPCTGSAASSLAAYLSLQDGVPSKRHSYVIAQGVEMGRAGDIHVDITLD